MTPSPLVTRLAAQPDAALVDARRIDAFLARGGHQVLFFGGDPVRFPEALDVAVVLPELRKALAPGFGIGVVAPDDEDALALRWGVTRWPSLVALRDGAYLGTLAGMHDWDAYRQALGELLQRAPSRPPGVGIRVVGPGGETAPGGCAA